MRLCLLQEDLIGVIASMQAFSSFCEVRIIQFQHKQIKLDPLPPAFIEFCFINSPSQIIRVLDHLFFDGEVMFGINGRTDLD